MARKNLSIRNPPPLHRATARPRAPVPKTTPKNSISSPSPPNRTPITIMTIRTFPLRSLRPFLRIPLPQTCLRTAVPTCLATEYKYKPTTIPTSPSPFHTSSTRKAADFDPRGIERQSEDVDVCIVGGGPAGLSAAIRLKQLAEKENREIRVLLLEKGSEMGSTPTTRTWS